MLISSGCYTNYRFAVILRHAVYVNINNREEGRVSDKKNLAYYFWLNGCPLIYVSGITGALDSEMEAQISMNKALQKYKGTNFFISNTGTSTITNIAVNSEFPLVSFITMIAPSPDWFVGVHDFNLCNTTTGKWLDSRKRDLPPYDAGTDSDTTFIHSGTPTMPRETIHLITNNTEGSLKSDKSLSRFGTFTFQKTDESGPTIRSSSSMQIQPSTNVNMESYTMVMIKESSTQKVNMKSTPNVPNQTPNSTTTLTASASVQMTPASTTTSAACSVKQHVFLHVVFAIILVKLFV